MAQSISFWKGKPMLLLPSNNMSVFLLWYIGDGFRGTFFFPHKPARPTETVCSEVHVWGMHTITKPSRTGFNIAVCASAYVRLVVLTTSAVLLHSDSRNCHTDSHWLCSALCNQWYWICSVFQWLCWPSKEQALNILHGDASSLCVWAAFHARLACWGPAKKQ